MGREGCEARLVEQENFEGFEERHQNLHAAPLPIRDHVHSPLEVNVEDMEQPLQPLCSLRVKGTLAAQGREGKETYTTGNTIRINLMTHPDPDMITSQKQNHKTQGNPK